ncbi:carbohydrate ABC transporter permease [Kitasatospora aureofaciens]|uniref:Sugar ABC transporter permease n=1 Tax=Kitasatospora aureofaciens TaxID=1894 RepID=A0A1E7N247_KITAU|nr:carbohydrate ABC transporter permease [Kitasatospora aureofaciens]ARF81869.1 sugar ABC transporter permease [Kitasatospora aureofaciens]OEV34768.1 sugar ABC transporter permease [Kitasatospora aureofaciens]UKZ03577.1 carbohydrate ABC transporter permease [Streptomyces viridifaciens]GGU92282.1 sugar ABC transporter permease [Kitasatospora aureofaciens]
MNRTIRRIADHTVLGLLALVFALPVLYLVIGSLKPSDQVLAGLSGFLPTNLSLHNYAAVLHSLSSDSTGHFWRFMGVSLLVAATVVAGGLVVNSMAAYALSRLEWGGRKLLFTLVLLLMLIPFESVAVPLFYLFDTQRNTVWIQAAPFIANAFSVYQFHTFFQAIPVSIEEAARIDGAGPWRILFRIIYPMSKPAFASVAILTFLTQWGSFLWPVLMVDDPSVRPLPLEISVFQGQQPPDWGQILAFGVLLVLPVVVVFAFFQRWFVQGVAGSAVKE